MLSLILVRSWSVFCTIFWQEIEQRLDQALPIPNRADFLQGSFKIQQLSSFVLDSEWDPAPRGANRVPIEGLKQITYFIFSQPTKIINKIITHWIKMMLLLPTLLIKKSRHTWLNKTKSKQPNNPQTKPIHTKIINICIESAHQTQSLSRSSRISGSKSFTTHRCWKFRREKTHKTQFDSRSSLGASGSNYKANVFWWRRIYTAEWGRLWEGVGQKRRASCPPLLYVCQEPVKWPCHPLMFRE